MKKLALFLCIALLAPLLSACLLQPVEELYEVPQMAGDVRALQRAIGAQMPKDSVYSPPTAGENQQSVQLADLDGDHEDEAIAFFQTDSVDRPLSMCVFDRVGGEYCLLARADFAGTGFERVLYAKIDDTEGSEIVVGRCLNGSDRQILSVYSLRGGELTELVKADYAEFTTIDLNSDGLEDLVLLRDGETKLAVAECYHYIDGRLVCNREVLSVPVENVRRLTAGKLEQDVPALFVASSDSGGGIVTDVLLFYGIFFRNLCVYTRVNTGVKMLADICVYGEDIDADGLTELPSLKPVRMIGGVASSKNHSIISWYNLSVQGEKTEKCCTYHNYADGWYLLLPEQWVEKMAIRQGESVGDAASLCVSFVSSEGIENIFSVVTVSSRSAAEAAIADGWTLLKSAGEVSYLCRTESAAATHAISTAQIREIFYLIREAWNTGETG